MITNLFFKPTPLYKEYLILDLIEKDSKTTQRTMSDSIGVSVSMINAYLESYEKKGYINRKYHSTKTVEYFVTKKGIERRKLLNIWYLQSSHSVYTSAKNNITLFLKQIIHNGFKNILLYGAGEVAEIMLLSINNDANLPLKVKAVIDDDVDKQNQTVVNIPIISLDKIEDFDFDGILVSSYKHHVVLNEKLETIGYPKDQTINFFE